MKFNLFDMLEFEVDWKAMVAMSVGLALLALWS